ncbi:FmdE family protein [Desulfatirhabdium butyrativorans]|uniref:FmdE family protein n=1 Tax=Desulfatirhabdium butyrativorans TaxID=340467 RepID=UPI000411E460|nr:FmdE family protein [Desulfatirhabdium butyrativorans]
MPDPIPSDPVHTIGPYSFEAFIEEAKSFHGYPAPGVVIGGVMVDLAMRHLPRGILFDAISETAKCLPDAIQMLTPCTTGNGWLKVIHLGRYALALYDKYRGEGVRVVLDPQKLAMYPELHSWFYKTKPKSEQQREKILDQIRCAGFNACRVENIHVLERFHEKRIENRIVNCPICGEGYPADHGRICRGCQGQSPYRLTQASQPFPALRTIPVERSVGISVLHDMTEIIPGKKKGPAFRKGDTIGPGDLCRLHALGKNHVFVDEGIEIDGQWVHENVAALAFARGMAGSGVCFSDGPREGKVTFSAEQPGMLLVEEARLEAFNNIPGVMAATRNNYTVLSDARAFAGTRAIPLFLPRADFLKAMSILDAGPLFRVVPLRKAALGVLVTGTEVFRGLIEDRFIPIIRSKAEKFECAIVATRIVPDETDAIASGIQDILDAGADILVTTAGLSVDPDDLTRKGLIEAGAQDMVYGAPILPGAMTLLARIGTVQVIGVPACALYFPTTSFDLLFPRLLASVPISRSDLARMGHGAFCLECKSCSYPKCPFGK